MLELVTTFRFTCVGRWLVGYMPRPGYIGHRLLLLVFEREVTMQETLIL